MKSSQEFPFEKEMAELEEKVLSAVKNMKLCAICGYTNGHAPKCKNNRR